MEKINFVNNQEPALNATNLNQLQTNVENAINGVVESGSNSNGSWIKFEDGTLIQYVTKNIPFTFTSYNKWGVMWESDLTDLGKFPIDFVDTPDTINITNYSSSGGFIESLQNTTNSQIGKMYICRPSDTNGVFNYYLSIIAIGRWK